VRQPARRPKGIPLRTLLPNAITALALCSGLFGIRYGIAGEWEKAAGAIVLAAFLDVMDGRIARLLKGQSRFGAELDSLSDVTAFGVAPAIILYQWMLAAIGPGEAAYEHWARYGWMLALAMPCAERSGWRASTPLSTLRSSRTNRRLPDRHSGACGARGCCCFRCSCGCGRGSTSSTSRCWWRPGRRSSLS
jgi:hypothetical protein